MADLRPPVAERPALPAGRGEDACVRLRAPRGKSSLCPRQPRPPPPPRYPAGQSDLSGHRLITERAPYTKEARGCVGGSLPPPVRSQHELSMIMANGPRAEGRNSEIPAGSPSPTLLPTGIPGRVPRGGCQACSCDEDSGRVPCRVPGGRGPCRPPHPPPFCIRACALAPSAPPPSTFADTRFRAPRRGPPSLVPTQSAARGACAQVRGLAPGLGPAVHPPAPTQRAPGHAPRR